jgi:hypothetical protein
MLTSALFNQQDSSGLFVGIVGMASQEIISLEPEQDDCRTAPMPSVRTSWEAEEYVFSFPRFNMTIAQKSDHETVKENAERLGRLIRFACLSTLSRVFRQAGDRFTTEQVLMGQAVDTWNRILRARRSERLKIQVTVSNQADITVFVKNTAKVTVGIRSAPAAIEQIARVAQHTTEKSDTEERLSQQPYVAVKPKSAVSLSYEVRLPEADREKLHGTYLGGLSALRMGLLVSDGIQQSMVLSQTVPFSEVAEQQSLESIRRQKVPLDKAVSELE